MNVQTVRVLSKLRRKSQADLARIAGVSRQAVSQWFKASGHAEVDVLSSHLKRLSDGLSAPADLLLRPLPVLGDGAAVRKLEATLLWDNLYPDLGDFAIALVRSESPALARLAQVFGLYRASKIAGRKVWDRFHEYKRQIRPVRRQQLERIWELHRRLESN